MKLVNQMNTLESAGLVRIFSAHPELEYLFRHALVQDVAYQSLLKQDRKQLHATVGSTLEQTFPDQLDELAPTIAYHYERAELREKAIPYLKRAGNRAMNSFANSEAIAFYQAAIHQIRALDANASANWRGVLAQLFEDTGDLLERTGQHDPARDNYDHVFGLLPASDRLGTCRVRRKVGYTWMIQAQHDKALSILDEAESNLGAKPGVEDSAWWQEWVQVQLDRMWLRYVRNEVEELQILIEKTKPALDGYGLPAQRSAFYRSLALGACRRGRYVISDTILENARTSLPHARASNNAVSIAEGTFTLGFCLGQREEWAEAEENLLAALRLSERIGHVSIRARALTHLTNMCRRRGEIARVQELNRQSMEAATSGQLREYIAAAKANAAWLAWRDGSLVEARELAESAVALWNQIAIRYPFQWPALGLLLKLALDDERVADAVEFAKRLVDPDQQRLREDVVDALEGGIRDAQQDRLAEARQRFAHGAELAREAGYL